ncbi:anther-specific proline-rich protein APG isoform X1 [Hermetia illucens]|uniref:anther-specific proline-rich protein APG isoform X1 n=1 Tax=Hermetia illucens TaxID=343691 RepID=UPI0018CC1533|nr:anther-specific proline-rich protein APG isoform X1 [Hermetia illucens]XP_037913221.1 anther-specific proline-rich protein APG isoform X1 [Hermetia illucens]
MRKLGEALENNRQLTAVIKSFEAMIARSFGTPGPPPAPTAPTAPTEVMDITVNTEQAPPAPLALPSRSHPEVYPTLDEAKKRQPANATKQPPPKQPQPQQPKPAAAAPAKKEVY